MSQAITLLLDRRRHGDMPSRSQSSRPAGISSLRRTQAGSRVFQPDALPVRAPRDQTPFGGPEAVKVFYRPTFGGDVRAETLSGIEQGDMSSWKTGSLERFQVGAPTSSTKPCDTGGGTGFWSNTELQRCTSRRWRAGHLRRLPRSHQRSNGLSAQQSS